MEDDRIVIIKPSQNIREMLEEVGYPFKSKEHSQKLYEWQSGIRSKYLMDYRAGTSFSYCPKPLRCQFEDDYTFKVSHLCCKKLKKDPSSKWAKENNKKISITGMRKEEGGQRTTLQCVKFDKNNKLKKFHPIAVVSSDFERWFIKQYDLKLSDIYNEPYGFLRTGCKGCPFNIDLQVELEIMEKFFPAERKQCELIWAPVYNEYRRLNYRLK